MYWICWPKSEYALSLLGVLFYVNWPRNLRKQQKQDFLSPPPFFNFFNFFFFCGVKYNFAIYSVCTGKWRAGMTLLCIWKLHTVVENQILRWNNSIDSKGLRPGGNLILNKLVQSLLKFHAGTYSQRSSTPYKWKTH